MIMHCNGQQATPLVEQHTRMDVFMDGSLATFVEQPGLKISVVCDQRGEPTDSVTINDEIRHQLRRQPLHELAFDTSTQELVTTRELGQRQKKRQGLQSGQVT